MAFRKHSWNPPNLFYNSVADMKDKEQKIEALKAKASLNWGEQKNLEFYEKYVNSLKEQNKKLSEEQVEAMLKAMEDGWPTEINASRIYDFALAFPCLIDFNATKYKDYKLYPRPKP